MSIPLTSKSVIGRKRNEWIAKLMSGETKKAEKTLHRTNGGMCCLGVLCHLQPIPLLIKKSISNSKILAYSATRPFSVVKNYEDSVLPDVLYKFIGLNDEHGSFIITQKIIDWFKNKNVNNYKYLELNKQYSLIKMNDDMRMSHILIGEFIKTFKVDVFKPYSSMSHAI